MRSEATVHLVDDDSAMLKALQWLIKSAGLKSKAYASAKEFLETDCWDRPGCLVLDVRMPRMNGLELQEHLTAQEFKIPVIFLTGHGDVPMAVRALKGGAVDFIEKPFSNQALLDRIHQCIERDASNLQMEAAREDLDARLPLPTTRETDAPGV